jgi:anti-sigma regulatory factor (Ser/Thr protein kinase)
MAPAVLRLTSTREDLGRVYPWLDQVMAGTAIPEALLSRMHVVLEEAVSNVAAHGFAPGVVGEITIRVQIGPDAVLLEVEDTGVAFDPTIAPLSRRAARLADVVPGGWGLGLIRRFCPLAAYQRRNGMNHLTMRFPLAV